VKSKLEWGLKLELGVIFRIGFGMGIETRIGFSIPIMAEELDSKFHFCVEPEPF
jgi:hypothetical protein